jgi:hypothetical protein
VDGSSQIIAGIETVQVMRYAARLIELQNQLGFDTPRTTFSGDYGVGKKQ